VAHHSSKIQFNPSNSIISTKPKPSAIAVAIKKARKYRSINKKIKNNKTFVIQIKKKCYIENQQIKIG
jgi:hypothetical protein